MANGIINSFIKGIGDFKNSAISKLTGDIDISQEVVFVDSGYIDSYVKRLKMEIEKINKEMQLHSGKSAELKEVKKNIELQIAFYLSNDFNNLEYCLQLSEGNEFSNCLSGLLDYKNGDIENAFIKLHGFLKSESGIKMLDHYLINKVYGLILANNKQEKLATVMLSHAVKLRPDDLGIHKVLFQLYKALGDTRKMKLEQDILSLFEKE